MGHLSSTHLKSPFAEQRERGFSWLRFSTPFVEEEFLQAYSAGTAGRARVMIALAAATLLVLIGARLAQPGPPGLMVAFEVFVTLPMLLATLYFSLVPGRHRLYRAFLGASLLLLGLLINSMVTRASMQGSESRPRV